MSLRFLSAADVRKALPMVDAIEGMKQAYRQLSTGKAVLPLRGHAEIPGQGTLLTMPAYLTETNDLSVKIVTIFPNNPSKNLPTIHAMVLALNAETGQPLAILEGGTVTAIRTGAGSGAATDILARTDSEVVAIIGSGVQARTQLEAVCTARTIKQVYVYSPNIANAERFAAQMVGHGQIPSAITVVNTPDDAIRDADIICAATTSKKPVFNGALLKPGTHINGVGSFLPDMQEVDLETVRKSLIVVDSREAVWTEAGELIIPLQNGDIDKSIIHAELGEIVAGLKSGRTDDQQITFFKSVGLGVQDAIAANIAVKNAIAHNLGTQVEW